MLKLKENPMELIARSGKALVRLTIKLPFGSGGRTGWVKHVTGVDRSQKGGYALQGEFLREGEQELPAGAVLVRMAPAGSVKNWSKEFDCAVIGRPGDDYIPWGDDTDARSVPPSFLDEVEEALREAELVAAAAMQHLYPEALPAPEPVDPRDARIAELEAEVARLKGVEATLTIELEALREESAESVIYGLEKMGAVRRVRRAISEDDARQLSIWELIV